MKELLKLENVAIIDRVKDWKDSIYVAVTPLVEQGYCEARYIDGIIENTEKFGPYYVLCENLALIHASTEQGVIKKQVAVTLVKEPFKFKEDGHDVRVLVTLAASDPESHVAALQAISNIFADTSRVERILSATQPVQIYNEFLLAASEG